MAGCDFIATLTLFTLRKEDLGIKLGFERIVEAKSFAYLFTLMESKLS